MYIMSYLFPNHIINLLEGDDFTVIKVPHQQKYDHAREREFYEFLYQKMHEPEFKKTNSVFGMRNMEERLSIPLEKN